MRHETTTSRRAEERQPIRVRLTATDDGGELAMAGALLRAAAAVRPFGVHEQAEVATRLWARERLVRRPLAWQLAVAAGLILVGGGLSAGVTHVLRARSVVLPATPQPSAVQSPAKRAHHPRGPAPAGDAAFVGAAAPDGPSPLAAARPSPAYPVRSVAMRERAPAPSVLPEPTSSRAPAVLAEPGVSPLAKQSRLLASALHELRQNDDAQQALTLLDRHARDFGMASALAPEANAIRIEALLKLGRQSEALVLLDALTPASTGVGREVLIARAELRAAKGRHATALHDFDLLLATVGKADAIAERARWGRASCRAKLGDSDGARRDLEAYLASFPDGRFAREARAALGTKDQ